MNDSQRFTPLVVGDLPHLPTFAAFWHEIADACVLQFLTALYEMSSNNAHGAQGKLAAMRVMLRGFMHAGFGVTMNGVLHAQARAHGFVTDTQSNH